MDKPDPKIITEIAQQLDCGNECYYNPGTRELICLPNAEMMASGDEDYKEIFRGDVEKVKSQGKNLMKFNVLESFESYQIMEDFKNNISDEHFKEKLDLALKQRKPFQNFKFLIDNSEYRADWFEFKQKELERIVAQRFESTDFCK